MTRRPVPQLGKLVRMLSSDQPGEVVAAAEAIKRTLAAQGLDIHALAAVVEAGLHSSPVPLEQPPRRPSRTRTPSRRRPCRPNGPLQMDDTIICDAPAGVFRPCRCGSVLFTVMPGVGPHVAQLRCDSCGVGGRWLSRAHFGAPA